MMFGVNINFSATEIAIGVVVCIIAIVYWMNRRLTHFKKFGVPYIAPWPFVGNLASVILGKENFGQAISKICNKFPTHKFIGYYEFITPNIIVQDLDMLRQVLVKDFDHFTDHTDFATEETDPLFVKNIFSLKGQKWRSMRSTLSPAFTSSKMKAMYKLVIESANEMTKFLLNDIKNEQTVDMKDIFTRYTNDVIATTAFGVKVNSLEERDNLFYQMSKKATTFGDLLFNLKMLVVLVSPQLASVLGFSFVSKDVNTFFRELVSDTISTREREGIIRPDMIHLLMQAKQGTLKEEGSNEAIKRDSELTIDDLAAQAFIFLFAGFETSSTLMCFAAHELAENQDVQRKLREEIDEVRANGSTVSYEALHNMKYLDMVISEALRKYPPLDVTNRVCVKPYVLKDDVHNISLRLKIGDCLSIPTFTLQRNPEYYPNPDKFDPERFSDDNKANIKPMTYLPFGGGPRICIGSRFALMETKIVLFYLLSSFTFEVSEKTNIPLILKKNFSVSAEGGFWIRLKARKDV